MVEITKLLQFAVEKEASDVLITAGSPPMVRIHGDLQYTKGGGLTREQTKKMAYGLLDDEQIARFESTKELDFSLELQNKYRFRGNMYLQRGCVGVALRLIPTGIPTLEELKLPTLIEDLAVEHQGLIIITGPTGHGKSTTQAAMIDIINERRKVHIVTIEDPIEFLHKNKNSVVDQREVGPDTRSFASALKHVLRQDPDVILVGEMRDLETISTALTAAETGHLVISTLHTNDTVQTVDRLIDVFPSHQQSQIRTQLAFTLLAVIAQRLLPLKDGGGRIVATEAMRNNSAVAHLIRDGKAQNIYTVLETHAREGMWTMDTSIKQLYQEGLISKETARRRMRHPEILTRDFVRVGERKKKRAGSDSPIS